MHNLIVLHEPAAIAAHYAGLWRTSLFRESQADPYGYVRGFVERLAQLPRGFFDMTVPRVEHSSFTPWFGATHYRREYRNPYVHDLFWLHEGWHQIGLRGLYDPNSTFEAWAERIIENEMRTALESEVMVYFELPDLRQHTFDFAIWADRFLDRPMRSRAEMYDRRRRAMDAPTDAVERAMSGYPHQNRAWTEIWRGRWREPERAMQALVRDAAADRRGAAQRHERWLQHQTHQTADRPYPFPDEAEAFAELFWGNKAAGIIPQDTGSGDGEARTPTAASRRSGRERDAGVRAGPP